ncbi:hypothetical protein [Niabella beijingensis]|uniref:hypothetical protein n=1 Tax=Niabella beijingensis TaxID=2872700 RepID=UPI001CBC5F72|nr:hypothetical protein [Niabella beijingensis]MBZ4191128.1 hypothetical protein [Niabella beijingensis]
MKKTYTLLLSFYIVAALIVFAFVRLSPDHPDGTPGLGSTTLIFFMVFIGLLVLINIIKGFTVGKNFFLVALIHSIVLFITYWIFLRP